MSEAREGGKYQKEKTNRSKACCLFFSVTAGRKQETKGVLKGQNSSMRLKQ